MTDIKPGEKLLVEGTALFVDEDGNVEARFTLGDTTVEVRIDSHAVHRASDFLRPKFEDGNRVTLDAGRCSATVRGAPRISVPVQLDHDSERVSWVYEERLQPAPTKTPLDKAREWLVRMSEDTPASSPREAEFAKVLLAELERRER